jgi:hypothetical protein
VFFSVSIRLAVQASLRLELSHKGITTEVSKFIFELGTRSSSDFAELHANCSWFSIIGWKFCTF